MKFLAIAIICAIVSATSVTAQGELERPKDRCAGKSEQDCKNDSGCQETYGNPRRSDGSNFHTSNARLIWDYTGCHEIKMVGVPGPMGPHGMGDFFNDLGNELRRKQQGKQQGQQQPS